MNSLRSVVIAMFLLFGAFSAKAADMTAHYRAAPIADPYNWTGLYIGATLGGGYGLLSMHDKDQWFCCSDTLLNTKSAAILGGGHLGYNWALSSSFIAGVEADFSGSSFEVSESRCGGFCSPRNDLTSFSSKLDSFATLRARFGLAEDGVLLYVTAGPALGHMKDSYTEVGCATCLLPGLVEATAKDDAWHGGIAAGAGIEYMFSPNFIFRAEYLHLELSERDFHIQNVNYTDPTNVNFRFSSTASADVARLGFLWKLNR
jgi:outer membrane immunogenic protein